MSISRVQFQKGLSLGEFMRRYERVEQCEAALMQSRWPYVSGHSALTRASAENG